MWNLFGGTEVKREIEKKIIIINTMRIIEIYGTKKQLESIKKLLQKYQEEITIRNIKLKYLIDEKFQAKLYGYDGELKKTVNNPSEITQFFKMIDNMPMGKVEKSLREQFSNREQLLEKCGLPNYNKTSHCFNDSTHHTCCMLGPEARKYADNSGNPIGITSEDAFYYRYGRKPDGLTSWCTCTGSKVCSYYADKFKDGTHIKFIGNLETKNEEEGISKLGIGKHKTPGVN